MGEDRAGDAVLCMCLAHEVRRGRFFSKVGGWLLGASVESE